MWRLPAVIASVAGLAFSHWQARALEGHLWPLGQMPDPSVIEPLCEGGTVSKDAVRRMIAATEYRLESFYPGPFEVRYDVDRMFAYSGGVLLHYRPAISTMRGSRDGTDRSSFCDSRRPLKPSPWVTVRRTLTVSPPSLFTPTSPNGKAGSSSARQISSRYAESAVEPRVCQVRSFAGC